MSALSNHEDRQGPKRIRQHTRKPNLCTYTTDDHSRRRANDDQVAGKIVATLNGNPPSNISVYVSEGFGVCQSFLSISLRILRGPGDGNGGDSIVPLAAITAYMRQRLSTRPSWDLMPPSNHASLPLPPTSRRIQAVLTSNISLEIRGITCI